MNHDPGLHFWGWALQAGVNMVDNAAIGLGFDAKQSFRRIVNHDLIGLPLWEWAWPLWEWAWPLWEWVLLALMGMALWEWAWWTM